MDKPIGLAQALRGTPAADVLKLTEDLYKQVRSKVAAGKGTRADIAACNAARREIKACKALGMEYGK